MRKITILSLLIASVSLMGFTFNPIKPADEKFNVDLEKSSMEWLCKKVTGQHNGTVKIKDGFLIFDGNTLKGGTFTMDMTTISVLDSPDNKRLIDDILSGNFFDITKFPTSTFTITKVTPSGGDQVNITGNLTVKGITKPVTFSSSVKKQGNIVAAVAKGVRVDRTKFDITFRSKTFFSSIGNMAVDDEFELTISLLAKK
jgi:polyisoprenoid-binding protein YceI